MSRRDTDNSSSSSSSYLTVHLSHPTVCLRAQRCRVRNLFAIKRTQIKPRVGTFNAGGFIPGRVYWRKRSRRRKRGSCISTFDLSSLACVHLVQLRMPFLWNSCRQSDPRFLLGTVPSVWHRRLPWTELSVCVLQFAFQAAARSRSDAGTESKSASVSAPVWWSRWNLKRNVPPSGNRSLVNAEFLSGKSACALDQHSIFLDHLKKGMWKCMSDVLPWWWEGHSSATSQSELLICFLLEEVILAGGQGRRTKTGRERETVKWE